jgi:hypothetical protein
LKCSKSSTKQLSQILLTGASGIPCLRSRKGLPPKSAVWGRAGPGRHDK